MSVQMRILQPIKMNNKICKNRVVMAAHSYGYVDSNGIPTDSLVDYLVERAKGGVGMMVMGGTSVTKESTLVEHIAANISDEIIPVYQKISTQVHRYGALILDQLMHVGGQLDSYEGTRIVAPSSIPHEICNGMPQELTIEEIDNIIDEFKLAASRVEKGGLDGVELKCDQGFLIHQFLSPFYNRRTDQYGGSHDNRLRFLTKIIETIRAVVDKDFIVGVRITGDSFAEGDLTIEDAVRISSDLGNKKLVDFIHVNGATNSSFFGYLDNHGDASISNMNYAGLARKIKDCVTIPVIATSKITHPTEAEQLLAGGFADLVAMTRPHIADPEIINKVTNGKMEDIRPCIYCNQGCVGNHWQGSNVHCIHNPATGRERELGIGTIKKSQIPKTVWVVGGGVAGMEFARVSALRGHHVTLFDKNSELGGQLLLASKAPYRQGMLDIAHYLKSQLKKSGVKIALKVEITDQDIVSSKEDFDVLAIATGSIPYIPPIYSQVEESAKLHIRDVLEKNLDLGKNVMIIDLDWRQNALGFSELLLAQGKNVTILSTQFYVGHGLDVATRSSYYSRIQNSARLMPLTALESFNDKTAIVRNVLDNKMHKIAPIDHIVFATGSKPLNNLATKLSNSDLELLILGDCQNPLGIPEAMLSANKMARTF